MGVMRPNSHAAPPWPPPDRARSAVRRPPVATLGEAFQLHLGVEGHAARVHAQHLACHARRQRHLDQLVEAARPEERGVGASFRLVAPITTTRAALPMPSISLSSVESTASRPTRRPRHPRRRPPRRAADDRIELIKEESGRARRPVQRTRATAAQPADERRVERGAAQVENATPLAPAAARASDVFAQPGGPCSSTPLGACTPSRL